MTIAPSTLRQAKLEFQYLTGNYLRRWEKQTPWIFQKALPNL